MPRLASSPVLRMLLAGALGAGVASGCSGSGEARRPVKVPVAQPSAAPSPVAVAPAPAATPEPAPASASAADPFAPLAPELARALFAIPSDPAPAKITLNTHYVVSNEDKPESFHGASSGRGGVYVGVGAEQSFMFGGWSRAELLFLMDFDDWVVDVNEVYGLIFEHARTPDELFAYWGSEHSAEVLGWIDERTPDEAIRTRRKRVYERTRAQVEYRLKWLRKHLGSDAPRPFFGNDQAEFDHIARLWRNRRVRCVRGDLTASGALRAFGELTKRAGWVVRTLYMSNAELYFQYDNNGFRDNLKSLPFDERSVILHTHPKSSTEYIYIWQEAPGYVSWAGRVQNFRDMMYEAKMPRQGKLENGAWLIKPP